MRVSRFQMTAWIVALGAAAGSPGVAGSLDLLEQPPTERLVFVGSRVKLERWPHQPDECEDCIFLDLRFKAVYRVEQVLEGSYSGDEIEFVVYDHYGAPDFRKYSHVLLPLIKVDGRWVHLKYQFVAVFPAEGGGFAGCAVRARESPDRRFVRDLDDEPPLRFDPPVELTLTRSGRRNFRYFGKIPGIPRKGKRVICGSGVEAEALHLLQMQDILDYLETLESE